MTYPVGQSDRFARERLEEHLRRRLEGTRAKMTQAQRKRNSELWRQLVWEWGAIMQEIAILKVGDDER